MRSLLGPLLACLVVAACGTSDRVTSKPDDEMECPVVVEDGGGGIDASPDGVPLCPDNGCNYQDGSGCDADEVCRPTPGSGEIVPTCVPAGSGRSGAACSEWASPSDCAPGYFCAEGVCRKLCCGGDWESCDQDTSCYRPLFFEVDGDTISADVGLCFPTGTCSVLDSESCADDPGRTCKIVDPTGAEACVRSGSGTVGEACVTPEYCGPGLSCVGGTCRRLCRAEACGEPACPESEGVCVHFDRNPVGVGECTLNFPLD